MNVLCIDSSGPVCGVAVLREGKVRFEAATDTGKTHSQQLMPLVELALEISGLVPRELDLIAAVAGPGSFTGVRIGIAAAKGLAAPFGIPCVPLNALEVLAEDARAVDGLICPILDARAGQVYCAAFRQEGGELRRVHPDAALKLDEWLAKLTGGAQDGDAISPYFLGDGIEVHRDAIRRALPGARFATPATAGIRAGCGGILALRRVGEAVPGSELVPLYLRAPQAERERAAREGR